VKLAVTIVVYDPSFTSSGASDCIVLAEKEILRVVQPRFGKPYGNFWYGSWLEDLAWYNEN
jgi:hypothetical protein